METHTNEKGSGNSMGNLKYAILGLLNQKEMTIQMKLEKVSLATLKIG